MLLLQLRQLLQSMLLLLFVTPDRGWCCGPEHGVLVVTLLL
jgi:hypothetical protein